MLSMVSIKDGDVRLSTIVKHYSFDLHTGEEGLGVVRYKTSSNQKFYKVIFCQAKVIHGDDYINYVEYDCDIDCSDKYPTVSHQFIKS